jgi:Protein of unknown function (DUF2911)
MSRKSLPFPYKYLLLAFAALLFTFTQAHSQCKPPGNQHPVLSPAAQASVTLNGKTLTVYYCAPSMRGRKIIGGLVPFDKVWRTGANTSTTFHTESNLRIGKQVVPAGTYTLYTLPSDRGWKLIINKQVGQWGTVYNESQDLCRIPMLDGVIPSAPVQRFTIHFEHTRGDKTELHLTWANANVYVPITAID